MGASASALVQQHTHESIVERVVITFHAMDANKSGTLSVGEISAFFAHSTLEASDASVQAQRWFYAMNTNKVSSLNHAVVHVCHTVSVAVHPAIQLLTNLSKNQIKLPGGSRLIIAGA